MDAREIACPAQETRRGLLTATTGALIFGALLGTAFAAFGYFVGLGMEQPDDGRSFPFPDIHSIVFGIIGLIVGLWLGQLLGCSLLLRLRGHQHAARTGATLGFLQAAVGFASIFVLLPIIHQIAPGTSTQANRILRWTVILLVPISCFFLPALARLLVIRTKD